MRYFIRFSFDGSHFYGFQRLKEKESVQGTLEGALCVINKGPVLVKGASRTDIGVHANGAAAHFDLEREIEESRLQVALNSIIHPYIHIEECKKVSDDFHARFSVVEKKYVYKIWCGAYDPKRYDYFLMYDKKLDVVKLRECARVLVGRHNFHNFVSGKRNCYDMDIRSIEVVEKENEVHLVFVGKSFYRYMVRNLVGAMLDFNEEKCSLSLVKSMVEEDDFSYQLSCASAKGLYLEGVFYENDF